jgi:Ferric reductase like transmembrane component
MAIISYWMALIPSSKNIVVFWLTGIPFERSIKYHKLCSQFALVSSLIHLALEARYNSSFVFQTTLVGNKITPLYGIYSASPEYFICKF